MVNNFKFCTKYPGDIDSHMCIRRKALAFIESHFFTSSNKEKKKKKEEKREKKCLSRVSVKEPFIFFLKLAQSKADKFQQNRNDLAGNFLQQWLGF